MALVLLLLGLAVDAELRHRARLESLEADLLAAALAFAVDALLDLLERLLDLRQQTALALAQPPLEGEAHLGRGRVDLVREIVRVEVDVSAHRALRLAGELGALLEQRLPELLEVPLPHLRSSPPLTPRRAASAVARRPERAVTGGTPSPRARRPSPQLFRSWDPA